MIKKIESVFIFVVIVNGEEKIMLWPDPVGKLVPLVYLSSEAVNNDRMRESMQAVVEKGHNMYCELREYKLVPLSEEVFHASKPNYHA